MLGLVVSLLISYVHASELHLLQSHSSIKNSKSAEVQGHRQSRGSWNAYVHILLGNAKGNCDKGALIGLDGGPWTDASDPSCPSCWNISPHESATIASVLTSSDYSPWKASGIFVAAEKFIYLGEIPGKQMFVGKSVSGAYVTIAKTGTSAIIARTPHSGHVGSTNLAAHQLQDQLKGINMMQFSSTVRDMQEDPSPVVLDFSVSNFRAGLAGDDAPKVNAPVTGNDFKSRVQNAYAKLSADPSKESVLITVDPLAPPAERRAMTQTMFETMMVPGLLLMNKAVLALYTMGITTGVSFVSNGNKAYAVPVFEGNALDYATITTDMTSPSTNGLAEVVYNSIMKCDVDIRKALYAGVLVTSSEKFSPDQSAFKKALEDLAPPTMTINVNIEGKDSKGLSSWIGGSILASLSTFPQIEITKQEYDETGPSVQDWKSYFV